MAMGPSRPGRLKRGLAPLLQWLVLPPPIVWLVRRQMLGERCCDCCPPGERDSV